MTDDPGFPPDIADAVAAMAARVAKNDPADDPGNITEDAIALEFARIHRDCLRYDHSVGKWFQWNSSAWREDETKLAFAWARRTCREIARDFGLTGSKLRTVAKAATAAAVERFAQSDQALAVTQAIWDQDLLLLGTPGGTVDLRTGKLRPADRGDYITKQTSIPPADTADCPRWLQFLDEVTRGDKELVRFLQHWCGYCLTGDISEHALLFAHGPGGNGKGVFLNTVRYIMGDYAVNAAMDTFIDSASDKHPTDLAMLRGARLVTASETEEGRARAETKVKALTGGDPITARFMRQDFFTYIVQFKLTIIGNHKPGLKNVDDANKRRINLVPFLFKPPKKDMNLEAILKAEAPGILRWAIDGCLDWQKNRLILPAVVNDATKAYFAEQDIFNQWIEECCDVGATKSDTVAALFKSWTEYCLANGERPTSSKWLSRTLEMLGYDSVKHTPGQHGKRGFKGIAVKLVQPRDWTQSPEAPQW